MMNFLDLSAASEEERRLIREILSDTSVVNIAEPQYNHSIQQPQHQHQPQQPQPPQPQPQQLQPQPQPQQQQQQQQPNSQLVVSPNNKTPQQLDALATLVNHGNSSPNFHRPNYNSQRKNIHNNNSVNSIGNNSGNINRNTRIFNANSATSVVNNVQHQHYPQQQYTPPLPSRTSSTHYHNMNINSHSANALNNQLNHPHQQRTNEHGNERLRSGLNSHMSVNSDVNNASTSPSGLAPITSNLNQHHGNTMSLNIYRHHTAHLHHQVPPIMPSSKLDPKSSGLKNQAYHSQDTSTSMQNNASGTQPVPPTTQMPPLAGDINSVIGMDMTTTQPPGYAIPPHVTAFGPPPHHVYSGAPIFQPYYHIIPYNLPSYVPYVIPPNSVVPPRQQVPLQSNHSPHSNTSSSSHPRHLAQQQNQEQYNSTPAIGQTDQTSAKQEKPLDKDLTSPHQKIKDDDGKKDGIYKSSSINEVLANPNTYSDDKTSSQSKSTSRNAQDFEPARNKDLVNEKMGGYEVNSSSEDKQNKGAATASRISSVSKNYQSNINKNKNTTLALRVDKPETHSQAEQVVTNAHGKVPFIAKSSTSDNELRHQAPRTAVASTSAIMNNDFVKVSSDEGFDTQSSLDISKQSQESSLPPSSEQSKSSMESCNKSSTDRNSTSEIANASGTKSTNSLPQRQTGAWVSASSKSWADLFKRGGNALNGDLGLNISGSENSDEENKLQSTSATKSDATPKLISHTSLSKEQRSQEAAKRALDKMAPRLAQKITSINLKHALPFLKPRGFINKGNGCYINATLQALIACPPFYNLMKEIGDLRGFRRENSCTPILDSFAEFFLYFPPMDSSKKNKQIACSDQKMHINNLQAEAIEPRCIYNVLGQIKSECLKGAQEDAEEFLSSVLNGLHEEMVGLSEVLQESNNHNGHSSDIDDSNDDIINDDNLWREAGSKNRPLPIRTAKVISTPIQETFGGSLFSMRTAGRDRCGHRSPFFDLQLDISGDNVKSVQDAIKSFTATEVIHDFYCSKTKQKLDAHRRTSLDQLPPILILHLKQFVYTQDHGLRKLIKKIEYPIDFELPDECLHEKNSLDKNLLTSRSYKLLAVVYHDGKEAIKGHYLTDVYHIGSSQWIRCDDSNLRVIPSPRIENSEATHRTPYLLFYRRLNTLRAQTSNYDNKKKN